MALVNYTSSSFGCEALRMTRPIVLYDGVCGLCNRLVQFLLKHDTHDRLRFASLQSDFGGAILKRHQLDHKALDSVCLVLNYEQPGEQVLTQSNAVLALGSELGGIWKVAVVGKVLPEIFRNWAYDLVAKNRYKVFGKYDSCMMPEGRYRRKFLDTMS